MTATLQHRGLRPLPPESADAEQRRIADEVASGPRGRTSDLLWTWLHSPQLTDSVQKTGAFFRKGTVLPPHIVELVILTTAQHWRCDVEWVVHAPMAIAKGLDAAFVEAVRQGGNPKSSDAGVAAAWAYASSWLRTGDADDLTVAAAVEQFGERGVVEMSILIGHYTHGAIVIKAARLPTPSLEPSPFGSR